MKTLDVVGNNEWQTAQRHAEVKEWAVLLRMLLVVTGRSDRRIKDMEHDEIHLFLTDHPRLGERAILAMCDSDVINAVQEDAIIRLQRQTAKLTIDHDTWYEKKQ